MVRASCVLWALWLVCAVSQPQMPPTRKPSAAPTVPGNATMTKVLSGSSVFYTFHNDIHCANPSFDYSVPSWGTTTRLNQCVVSPDGLSRRKLLCKLGERMFTLQMGTFALADKSCNKALSYNRAVHRDICAWDFERLGNSLIHCGDDRALLTLQRGATGYLSRAIWPNSRCGSAQEAKVSRVYLSTCTPIWHAKHLGTAFDVARNFKIDSPSIANNWLSLRVLEYAADDLQCAGELTKVWTVRYLLSGPTDGAPRCIPDPLTGNNSFYSSASGAGLPVIWGVSGLYPTPSPTPPPTPFPTRPSPAPTAAATLATESTDGNALCAFYDAVTSKTPLTNWCGSKNALGNYINGPCTGAIGWVGVTCTSGRVTRLSINSASLVGGSIPTELGGLQALTWLDLGWTSVGGTLPTQLGLLTKLESMIMGGNKFTKSIPTQFGQLASLTGLYMQENRLTGSIPSQIGGLTGLTDLLIEVNSFSGSLPSQLGLLTNMKRMWLYSLPSLVGAIPASFCSLSSTIDLQFSSVPGLTCYPSCLASYANFMSNKDSTLVTTCAR